MSSPSIDSHRYGLENGIPDRKYSSPRDDEPGTYRFFTSFSFFFFKKKYRVIKNSLISYFLQAIVEDHQHRLMTSKKHYTVNLRVPMKPSIIACLVSVELEKEAPSKRYLKNSSKLQVLNKKKIFFKFKTKKCDGNLTRLINCKTNLNNFFIIFLFYFRLK